MPLPATDNVPGNDSAKMEGEIKGNSAQEFSTDLLRLYYARLFPYDPMFNWLSYGNDPKNIDDPTIEKDFFSRREWSFTVGEIYTRYRSYKDKDGFMNDIQKFQPHKIDIGAVFSAPPNQHTTVKPELFKPVERELVFDIDMTDYDDIRTCCTEANICLKCWPFMTMAIKVLDKALRDDFAFKNILWIYSGRRGVHCWVCDPEARSLPNEARGAIVDYLSVQIGSSENTDKKIKSTFETLHPSLQRAYDILEPYFEQYIAHEDGQGLFTSKKLGYRTVLNSLPEESLRRELDALWQKENSNGAEKFRRLVEFTTPPKDHSIAKKKRLNYPELLQWRQELVFKYCYPRLDANVSKTQNHLLKSPFCIHPKTGRVCIPIDAKNPDAFNPFTVPTVRSLCDQIDQFDHSNKGRDDTSADFEKTSLKNSIDYFNKYFLEDLYKGIRKQQREKRDQIAANNFDF